MVLRAKQNRLMVMLKFHGKKGELKLFESIVLRHSSNPSEGPLDAGLIAEALLFYQSVHLLLDHGSLMHLLKTIGPEHLIRLMKDHGVKITYFQEMASVHTDSSSGLNVYSFQIFSSRGDQSTGPLISKTRIIEFIFQRILGKSRATRRLAHEFVQLAELSSISTWFSDRNGVPGITQDILGAPSFLKEAVRISVRHRLPEFNFPSQWEFRTIDWKDGFLVDSNLNLNDSALTPANLLLNVCQGGLDLRLASNYSSEYATTDTSSLIAQVRLQGLANICSNQTDEIKLFQNSTIDKAASIREEINSGNRSFGEFLNLLEEADRFKRWLHKTNPDRGVLQQYHDDLIAKTGFDKLAPKSIRFAIATGLGALAEAVTSGGIGLAAGVAVGATDTFLLDKLLKGWNPSHFVSGPLKDFVDSD